MKIKLLLFGLLFRLCEVGLKAQTLYTINHTEGYSKVVGFNDFYIKNALPLFTFELNGNTFSAADSSAFASKIAIQIEKKTNLVGSIRYALFFKNTSKDTLALSNILPFGASPERVYITGLDSHWLSRTHLFLPNRKPVNVIVPDNAWELGYGAIPLNDSLSVYALTRRKKWDNAIRRRFLTQLLPNGTVEYELNAELYQGDWQTGLTKAFQQRYLYDVDTFDNQLFERQDLQWIRKSYVMHLIMAWDSWFYDKNDYQLLDFLKKGKKLYGGDDVVGIWPTWPTLGLDKRNQFDLFQDLPGGLPRLKLLAQQCRDLGTKFFICYNPWDESTSGSDKGGNHLSGLTKLIAETDADGVVLDTRGASSKELQAAADVAKKGVVMYSEGMAVPKDMLGIVSGRVHNALYYPPMLNLNKLIKPEFAIFRVAEIYKEPIKREFATSFFNGYGTELNVFKNGKPDWLDEQYRFLGRTSRILRENSTVFTAKNFKPLIPTLYDSIYVNQWSQGDKLVYTVFSLIPQGFNNQLFEVQPANGYHFVDVWHHKALIPHYDSVEKKYWIQAETDAFNQSYLGTNTEGGVDCIIRFKKKLIIAYDFQSDRLEYEAQAGDLIKIWLGNPAYDKDPMFITDKKGSIQLMSQLGNTDGKIIIQLFENGEIIDEHIIDPDMMGSRGKPRLVSVVERTLASPIVPKGMVKIPGGSYKWVATHGDDWVSYPDQDTGKIFKMPSFWIDQNLVTNLDFDHFLKQTHYKPTDTSRFLIHWGNKSLSDSLKKMPVVNISYEDACTYCAWQKKRLPTEREWQYAAQYPDNRLYPWGNTLDSTKSSIGNGRMNPIGNYPTGANALQINDLVGNVWQLTHDVYQNASYRYILLKGGSHFKPTASWWYVQGGIQPLTHRQILLRVSSGFERNGTVGFRCARD